MNVMIMPFVPSYQSCQSFYTIFIDTFASIPCFYMYILALIIKYKQSFENAGKSSYSVSFIVVSTFR